MLFDLRSRGRRTTVRGVYLLLAILMGGGLILFGVTWVQTRGNGSAPARDPALAVAPEES